MRLLGRNVEYLPRGRMSPWRKIAIGTWDSPGDPTIYGRTEVDATRLLSLIEHYRTRGVKVTPLTVTAKAVAMALRETPKANSVIRYGRLYQRRDVDVMLVAMTGDGTEDLTGILVRDCDAKSVEDIAGEIAEQAAQIRSGEHDDFRAIKRTLDLMPGAWMNGLLKLLGFMSYTFNVWLPLGLPKDAMGSAQVTSMADMAGDGWGALDPYARIPVMVVVGRIEAKPVVVGDAIVSRPMMPLCLTLDHRIIDGFAGARIGRSIREYLTDRLEVPDA